ncbi:MAG TPA: signal peptidase II [Actinomycetota bacterium]
MQRHAAVVLFSAAGVAYFLDRVSKIWVERTLPGEPIEVIPGVFTLRFTTNSGGAFSIGGSTPWIFATATIVVSIVIVATAFRHRSILTAIALGLILGGALGNLTDRIARGPAFSGKVVDFVDLHVWPIFNMADSAIVVGAVLLAIGSFRSDRRDPERADPEGSP